MKKVKNINICLVVFTLLILSGCGSFLDEPPDNRVELNTLDKASQLITNAYSSAGYTFDEWMSDNVSYISSTQKLPEHNQAYSWLEFTGTKQDTPTNFWTSTYDAIAHTNEVLAVIDDLPGEKSRRDAVKGEALLARAYGHFMLVNLFAKHYNSSTASTDLGIPYVTEPEREFIKKYTRLSVKEVYNKVEKDILAGLKLVDDSFYANSGKYHFTARAGLALASRFYLYKGELDKCIDYSSQLLGANPDVFVKDISALLAEKINDAEYARLYTSPNDDSNILLMRQVTNFHRPNVGFWMSNGLYKDIYDANPFGADDNRKFPSWVVGSDEGAALSKFEFLFERSSLTSNVGYNYIIFLGFRGEEVLLNRAESYIFQGQLQLALDDIQLLATKRYDGDTTLTLDLLDDTYGTGNDQENLFRYLMDERVKEFMHEGLRWFDIKRYQIPVIHELPDGPITLSADDKRKVIQIPQAAIDVGGLEPNPR